MNLKKLINLIKKTYKSKKINLHEPNLDTLDILSLKQNIQSKFVSTAGRDTIQFENKIKKLTSSKYSIAVNSGTSGLFLSLLAIGVKKNDEVLVPGFSFIASANSVLYANAKPHFVDITLNDLGIDFLKLENYIKKIGKKVNKKLINKKTNRQIKALMLVHVFGHAANIESAIKFCKKYNLKLIEDAAEGIGSFYKGEHLGTFGNVGVISFNGNKTITTGSGGIVLTNDKKIAEKVYNLSIVSKKPSEFDYNYNELGYNLRMSSLNAALGISQLKKLKKILKSKRIIAQNYKKFFINNYKGELSFIDEPKKTKSNFWLNAVYIENSSLIKRNEILRKLKKNNIYCRPGWKPLNQIQYLRNFPQMKLKNSDFVYKSVINLPSSPLIK